MRKILKLKIVEYFDSQERFSTNLQRLGVTGIDATLISRIIRQHRNPTPAQADAFVKLLHTPIDQLMKGDDDYYVV